MDEKEKIAKDQVYEKLKKRFNPHYSQLRLQTEGLTADQMQRILKELEQREKATLCEIVIKTDGEAFEVSIEKENGNIEKIDLLL